MQSIDFNRGIQRFSEQVSVEIAANYDAVFRPTINTIESLGSPDVIAADDNAPPPTYLEYKALFTFPLRNASFPVSKVELLWNVLSVDSVGTTWTVEIRNVSIATNPVDDPWDDDYPDDTAPGFDSVTGAGQANESFGTLYATLTAAQVSAAGLIVVDLGSSAVTNVNTRRLNDESGDTGYNIGGARTFNIGLKVVVPVNTQASITYLTENGGIGPRILLTRS